MRRFQIYSVYSSIFFLFQPQNRRFQYSLSGEDSKYFAIDPSSGLLTVNASLDYEQGKFNFSFKVMNVVIKSLLRDEAQSITIALFVFVFLLLSPKFFLPLFLGICQ